MAGRRYKLTPLDKLPPIDREAQKPADVEAVLRTLKNPRAAAKAILKFEAEQSLLNFFRMFWPLIEPGQPLVVGWALSAMCEYLEACFRGDITRLLANVPPGTSKSTAFGVMYPAWVWGPKNRAEDRFLSWSYAAHLSKRDNSRCRDIIESPLYQAMWGKRVQLDPKKNTEEYYKNLRKGFRIASSVDGVGTGERGDDLLFDDPHSVAGGDSEAQLQHTVNFFAGTLTTRTRNADDRPRYDRESGQIARPSIFRIIMQRIHSRDISGQIIANELGYEHLMIEMEYEGTAHPLRKKYNWKPHDPKSKVAYEDPRERFVENVRSYVKQNDETVWTRIAEDMARLVDPVRFPRHVVEITKKTLLLKQGTNAVASQLRQWPFDTTGAIVKREFIKPEHMVHPSEVPASKLDFDVRGWDLASSKKKTADRTATVRLRWGVDDLFYVLHARAYRKSVGEVEDWIKRMIEWDREIDLFGSIETRPSLPIDPAQAGESQAAHFSKTILQGTAFIQSREWTDKKKRMYPWAAQVEHGNFRFVIGEWNAEYFDEICSFPVGDHDDLVDGTSRAYDGLVTTMDSYDGYAPKVSYEGD